METDDQDNREREIFNQALEMASPEERLGFIKGACGQDALLLERVRSLLLAADDQSEGFLPDQPKGASGSQFVSEKPGARIDQYKVLQKIGEGGCGIVYMAEQSEPVRRRVALKIVKLGMDTRQVVARFEAERQALAMMDHPNIAKVFDAGSTETGRPYFVMELVRGIKITEYCDQNKLGPRERLELFLQVCRAIQHAHQKGIIHRDIKPSNVLVTLQDGVALPKIIDFGIAKATGDLRLTDKTMFTAFELFIGTPAYMSPEQAGMGGMDIDTRSDIYSLGVLLYELLTGKTPFDARTLIQAGLDEMRRIIRENEPARPSTLLSTLAAPDLLAVAQHRHADAPKLISLLRGDLDWIVMKTLEKDRARRYETANGLAMDIQRHLQSEPVQARPPSTLYRLQKCVRRNKGVAATVTAVTLALAVGLGLATWQYLKSNRAYLRAIAAEHAESRLRQAAQEAQRGEAQQRQRAEATLVQLELQKTEELFTGGDSSGALAYLARLLRQNRTNQVAAERLASALTYRNFSLPVSAPIENESPTYSAEFSRDGTRVVTSSADKTARVWDAQTGRPVTSPLKHESDVVSAHFSPDGRRVVTSCGTWGNEGPSYAQVWDAATGQPLTDRLKHRSLVSSVQFSPDGESILTASYDGTARLWDAKTGQASTQIFKHGRQLTSAQFSPDGQRVVTTSFDGIARVWNSRTGDRITKDLHQDGHIVSAEFSSDGQRIITASADQVTMGGSTGGWTVPPGTPRAWDARIWDANTGEPLTPPLQHAGGVSSARFSPDGQRVVTASLDKTARVWDAKTGQPIAEPLRHGAEVTSAEFSPDGQRVVTASLDKTARVWDMKTGRPLTEPLRSRNTVKSAHFSPDGQRVVTASDDRTIRVWDTRLRQPLTEPLKHGSLVISAHFSPDGKRVVTSSYDHTARIWDAQSGQPLAVPLQHDNPLEYAQFSPDGLRVVTAVSGGSARVWDAQTGRPLTEPLYHSNHVDYAEFSPDGLRVATAAQDNTARVWDAQSGRPLTDPLQHTGVVWSARFSPDGLRVLTASMDKTARIWDARTGKPVTPPLQHDGSVLSAEFSFDGLRVVTASGDSTARVWDAKTGRMLISPLKHEDLLYCAHFSRDGQRVVTGSQDKTARLWDASTGQPLTGPLLHAAGVTAAQFSPDGQRVVTASWDKTARIWDARTGQPLSEPLQHQASVTVARFSPDGQRLITVAGDTARVWQVPNVPVPVPDWVPDMTEAIGESRLDDQGISQSVPFAKLEALRNGFSVSSASDVWSRLAKWLFADPANRTISPFSEMTMQEYTQRRLRESAH